MNGLDKKHTSRWATWKLLSNFMFKIDRKSIVGYILCAFLLACFPACNTILLSKISTSFFDVDAGLWFWGLTYALLLVAQYILEFISNLIKNMYIYDKCTNYCKERFGEKSTKLPLVFYDTSWILNIQHRAKVCIEEEYISEIFVKVVNLIVSIMSIITIIVILAKYHVIFCLLVLISVLPFFLVKYLNSNYVYNLTKEQSYLEQKNKYFWNLFFEKNSLKELKITDSGIYLQRLWTENCQQIHKCKWQYKTHESVQLCFCEVIKLVGYVTSVFITILLFRHSVIDVGLVAACLTAFKLSQDTMKSVLIDFGNLFQKLSYASDYFTYLRLDEEPIEQIGLLETDLVFHSLGLKGISFSYENSECILKCLDLKIERGEKIVLLGENGSGKTTLVKILLGLYCPSEGVVLLNGEPINSQLGYKRIFSAVEQNFVKYQLSIRENICVSKVSEQSNDRRIRKSLKDVGLRIANLPLDDYLGTEFGGIDLSGGEWQKLAIARASFRDSSFYVLDEPTSALDPLIENEVLEQFLNLVKDETALIISHRIGVCKLVDRIVVLSNGQIIEQGSHSALLKLGGEYSRLYHAQEQWYQ